MIKLFIFLVEEGSTDDFVLKILISLLIVFVIGFNVYKLLDFISYYFYRKPFFIYFPFFLKKLKRDHRRIIIQNFPFYTKLPLQKQRIFDHRVVKFISYKEFVAREGFVLTDEVKVQIASCAVFLSFGMRFYDFPSVHRIIIYPDIYYSNMNDEYHKGEFNPMHRTVVFSWKHFLIGFEDSDDGINLGLHEFAHALFFSNLRGENASTDIFQDGLEALKTILLDETKIEAIKSKKFLRQYGFSNNMEFFSVCIEALVEKQEQFKLVLPELYHTIIEMLNFSFIEKKRR
ncbi:hypothetical protein NBRC110019_02210 [Neptunitalea chrysea]|uniref:Zinc-dependent peptidase n=1 Tax=Neptunitalea chrysea TaxID=1647581 RepID=A0A9W6B3N6_9FLAO|nr:zinc-dependent peptidase [Neptunitalea chrysea]GLB51182.1 hypothetical protein NBRC110019_02210 [Neptunitalea chrysea]